MASNNTKETFTLKEIIALAGLSENSVKRRIAKLGIKSCGKISVIPRGVTNLYSKEDAERILEIPRQRIGPRKAAVYYRVSVLDGPFWIVKHAGLGIAEARRYGRDFIAIGMKVRITGSNGKVIYMREKKNESA